MSQKCAVFAPDYPKAPEHPYPAGQLGCLEAVHYIFSHAQSLEIDSDKVIFAGDSAGAMLAVNMWHRLLSEKSPFKPCALSLLYPCMGYSPDVPR